MVHTGRRLPPNTHKIVPRCHKVLVVGPLAQFQRPADARRIVAIRSTSNEVPFNDIPSTDDRSYCCSWRGKASNDMRAPMVRPYRRQGIQPSGTWRAIAGGGMNAHTSRPGDTPQLNGASSYDKHLIIARLTMQSKSSCEALGHPVTELSQLAHPQPWACSHQKQMLLP